MNFMELVGPIEDLTPAHTQKAVLWGGANVLLDAVEFFLRADIGWDVVKITTDLGNEYLLQRVETLRPAVVILCQEKDISDIDLLARLAQLQFCSKVVVVNLESNVVQVYRKQNFTMRTVSDLISIVETEYLPKTEVLTTKH